ncbi:hypothetical protein PAPYR_6716 [Paratrimastix pyriformis]|uniref:Uncharacterized protein n=1 Tax=Paratrimastix pyriformis TaxID=342808 RepID=A0ABQ8UEI0_9EUKA|nr:hypothetical protein PAPYR_6716 [Paratrimastix pyriformis]
MLLFLEELPGVSLTSDPQNSRNLTAYFWEWRIGVVSFPSPVVHGILRGIQLFVGAADGSIWCADATHFIDAALPLARDLQFRPYWFSPQEPFTLDEPPNSQKRQRDSDEHCTPSSQPTRPIDPRRERFLACLAATRSSFSQLHWDPLRHAGQPVFLPGLFSCCPLPQPAGSFLALSCSPQPNHAPPVVFRSAPPSPPLDGDSGPIRSNPGGMLITRLFPHPPTTTPPFAWHEICAVCAVSSSQEAATGQHLTVPPACFRAIFGGEDAGPAGWGLLLGTITGQVWAGLFPQPLDLTLPLSAATCGLLDAVCLPWRMLCALGQPVTYLGVFLTPRLSADDANPGYGWSLAVLGALGLLHVGLVSGPVEGVTAAPAGDGDRIVLNNDLPTAPPPGRNDVPRPPRRGGGDVDPGDVDLNLDDAAPTPADQAAVPPDHHDDACCITPGSCRLTWCPPVTLRGGPFRGCLPVSLLPHGGASDALVVLNAQGGVGLVPLWPLSPWVQQRGPDLSLQPLLAAWLHGDDADDDVSSAGGVTSPKNSNSNFKFADDAAAPLHSLLLPGSPPTAVLVSQCPEWATLCPAGVMELGGVIREPGNSHGSWWIGWRALLLAAAPSLSPPTTSSLTVRNLLLAARSAGPAALPDLPTRFATLEKTLERARDAVLLGAWHRGHHPGVMQAVATLKPAAPSAPGSLVALIEVMLANRSPYPVDPTQWRILVQLSRQSLSPADIAAFRHDLLHPGLNLPSLPAPPPLPCSFLPPTLSRSLVPLGSIHLAESTSHAPLCARVMLAHPHSGALFPVAAFTWDVLDWSGIRGGAWSITQGTAAVTARLVVPTAHLPRGVFDPTQLQELVSKCEQSNLSMEMSPEVTPTTTTTTGTIANLLWNGRTGSVPFQIEILPPQGGDCFEVVASVSRDAPESDEVALERCYLILRACQTRIFRLS